MSDLIDRVEAIRAIKEYVDKHAFNSYYSGMNRACKVLLTVPSVEPENDLDEWKAHWYYYDSDNPKYDNIGCSVCGHGYTVDAEKYCDIGVTVNDFKYCPNCGAKMEDNG